jgi:hypothetical protein
MISSLLRQLPLPITQQLTIINEEKEEIEPLRSRNPFHERRHTLMVKKRLTNGSKQTISVLPFYGGYRANPAIKKPDEEAFVHHVRSNENPADGNRPRRRLSL